MKERRNGMNKKNGFSINLGGLELGDTSLIDNDIFETPVESVEIKREKEIVRPRLIEKTKEVSKSDIIKKFEKIGEHETSIETGDMGLLCSDEDFDDSFDSLTQANDNIEQAEQDFNAASEDFSFDDMGDCDIEQNETDLMVDKIDFDENESRTAEAQNIADIGEEVIDENNSLTNEGGNLSSSEEDDGEFSLDDINNFEYAEETEDEPVSVNEMNFDTEATEPEGEDIADEIDELSFEDEEEETSSENLADEIDNINFEDEEEETSSENLVDEIDGLSFEDDEESLDNDIDNTGFEDNNVAEKSDENNGEDEDSFSLDDLDNVETLEETEDCVEEAIQEDEEETDIKIEDSTEDTSKEDEDSFSLDDIDSIDAKDVENSVENVNNNEQSLDLDSLSFSDLQEDDETDESLLEQFDTDIEEVNEEPAIVKADKTVKDTRDIGVEKTKDKNNTSGDRHSIKEIDSMQEIRADIADIKRIIQSGGRAGTSNRASSVGEDKNREFRKNSKSPDPKAEIERYSSMTIDSLYKEVKEFMIQNGVKRCPVALDILNKKFGDKNIIRLVRTSYLIILGKGVTIGR